MRLAWTIATAASLLPGAAAALSCAEYSIRSAYWYHEERATTYVLVLGSFSDLTLVEATPTVSSADEIKPGRTVYSARFEGFHASHRAFDKPFATDVTLIFPDFSFIGGGMDTAAAADWLPGQTGLVWLEKTAAGYQLTAELCEPLIDTDPASVKPALNCLAGRWCPKDG